MMMKKSLRQEIPFEKAEIETCLNALNNPRDERMIDKSDELFAIFRKFQFFNKMTFKYTEIREQETNLLVQKCLKYMTAINYNPQEMITERGRKTDHLYLVLRGKIGLFVKKSPQEIENELESWRKTYQNELPREENAQTENVMKEVQQVVKKVKPDTLKKLKVNLHKLGSLAKENAEKFHLKGEVYKIKEVGEVLPGYHIFEECINAPQISEYTIIAKESSDLIAIRVCDYQKAVQEVRNLYKARYKLLQKSFLTSDEVPLNKIAMYFVEHRYSSNEVIFKEEHPSDKLYCVASGEIHLLQSRKKRDTVARGASYLYGYTNLVDTILVGNFFGDEWFYEEKERRYTAVAKSEETVLLARLCSHHPDLAQRLRSLLELKREIRRRKVDPLDKKRARDYYVNLADFKNFTSRKVCSPVPKNDPETSKSPLTLPKFTFEISLEPSTKESNLNSIAPTHRAEHLISPLTNLPKRRDSSNDIPINAKLADQALSPSFKFLKPGFKLKPFVKTPTRKLHSRSGSLDPESFKQSKTQNYFEFSRYSLASPKFSSHKKQNTFLFGNTKESSKATQEVNQSDTGASNLNLTEKNVPSEIVEQTSKRQQPWSVKEQIDSLAKISEKLGELSTMIRIQGRYFETLHGNSIRSLHQPKRSVQIQPTLPNFGAADESDANAD